MRHPTTHHCGLFLFNSHSTAHHLGFLFVSGLFSVMCGHLELRCGLDFIILKQDDLIDLLIRDVSAVVVEVFAIPTEDKIGIFCLCGGDQTLLN